MEYAIVDIETTGGVPANSGITEIAIVLHNGLSVTGRYTTLINPQRAIPAFITSLTGINMPMVANSPTFEEVAPYIHALLKDRIFVAHNVSFDFSFVKHYLSKAGYELNVSKLCTVRMSRKTFPGFRSYSLGVLCKELNIPVHKRHRAMGDAEATTLLFEKILLSDSQGHIAKMLKKKLNIFIAPRLYNNF
ncbi:MAG: 3'-5' exonuclease [Chitinophagaceae bacterium]|jgi:DNA polymerase-3 subunit epsilon|nr:3'-5' exonuclease [Chitinophagaceae bacterium]